MTGICPRFKKTFLPRCRSRHHSSSTTICSATTRQVEPTLDELAKKGFSADYVFREVKHSVASANGKTKIYAGVGSTSPAVRLTIRRSCIRRREGARSGCERRRRLARVRGDAGRKPQSVRTRSTRCRKVGLKKGARLDLEGTASARSTTAPRFNYGRSSAAKCSRCSAVASGLTSRLHRCAPDRRRSRIADRTSRAFPYSRSRASSR